MKTFSSALTNALSAPVKRPVCLLQLELSSASGSLTLYLADQPFTLWGQVWAPLVMKWGAVDRYFDPSADQVSVSDMTVLLDNSVSALGAGMNNISWYFRKYDLAGSTASLYLWLDGAGLTPPSGANLNDLVPMLTGTPELSSEVTPAVCSLDIVNKTGSYDNTQCSWGDLLPGQYSRNQWDNLPAGTIGKWKPAVFGSGVLCEGTALSGPVRVGKLEGPSALFDPASGSSYIEISFPQSGEYNVNSPVGAPCDIFVGDWRFSVKQAPQASGGVWRYNVYSDGRRTPYYLPSALKGATPLFVSSSAMLWPRSSETGAGPYASSEPPRGAPYQFYHGVADYGNSRDGIHFGKYSRFIQNVYADGVEVNSADMLKDDAFGTVWLRTGGAEATSKVKNPARALLKFSGVDTSFNSGDAWMRAGQLTLQYPYGYNAQANPCILGDFSIPASGGGAPASSRLGLTDSVRWPMLGTRVAQVRLVMRYTGVEFPATAPYETFNLRVFGRDYSFSTTELTDGAGISGMGFDVTLVQRGPDYMIWPDNNGYPWPTAASPNARRWDIYELSIDVTADALANISANNGMIDSFRAWYSGYVWPQRNTMIVLSVQREVTYDSVADATGGARVTALVSGGGSKAGEILAEVIPAGEQGSGFNDSSLPDLKYRINKQTSVCRFVKTVARESNTELVKNPNTGKWDLIKRSDIRDHVNTPPPTGGLADVNQDDMLTDASGAPMILRSRSAPESVINEVTVIYIDESARKSAVTLFDQGSIDIYGVKRYSTDTGANMTRASAEERALDILNANSDVNDFYSMTFPLGTTLALEPNDILQVTADMDSLFSTKMRVVSVEINPGSLAGGEPGTITINAQRYSQARRGFGQIPFGQGPFGAGQIMEN